LIYRTEPVENASVDIQSALRILRELHAEFPQNGVFSFFAIAVADRAGEDPMRDLDAFVSTTEFTTPEDWLDVKTSLQGMRTPTLFLVGVGMASDFDIPNYLPSKKWLQENIPLLTEGQRDKLQNRLELVAQAEKAHFDQRLVGGGMLLAYGISRELLIGLHPRGETKFPPHTELTFRRLIKLDEFVAGLDPFLAERCDSRGVVRSFDLMIEQLRGDGY